MTRVWLASYPKSGSTWFRMLIAALSASGGRPLDINGADVPPPISLRDIIEEATLVDTDLLTHDEADALRASVNGAALDAYEKPEQASAFYKVHEAYVRTPAGDPVLGRGAAGAAILVVRDPRDVAVSLAAHFGQTIDWAIAFMGRPDASLHAGLRDRRRQFRQRILSWTRHSASWLDQTDLPVHVVHYEALRADTAGVFQKAMAFAGCPVTAAEARRAADLASFGNLQSQERQQGFSEGTEHGLFFRQGQSGRWRDSLTPEQARRLETDQREGLRRLGYQAVYSEPVASGPGSVASSAAPRS